MKPRKLKISGLNSFMEEQAIDFSQLAERGLFGIFGPTGSGKSTILDAITLALYGEIPRAGKDLSGVVNSHSQQADIYYEFEIGNTNNRKVYFIQRCFKRDKQGSIKTNMVKLCDITQREPIVLGEKVHAVNQQVGEILGLKCNDFTRSVVLPQGNFSEFLKLSGREKRDMLERIFALEEYGSRLSRKIRLKKKKVEEQLTFVEGQLQHLKGVSQEIYKELQREREQLKEQQQTLQKQWEKIEEKYQYYKELWKLQQEYQGYLITKKNLDQEQEHIHQYREELELAQRAKNIQPYMEACKENIADIKKKEHSLEKIAKEYERQKTILEKVTKEWQAQQDKKENSLPQLLERRGKIQGILNEHKQKEAFIHEVDVLLKEEKALKSQSHDLGEELATIGDRLKQLEDKKIEMERNIEKIQISTAYREKLYKGYQVEKEYEKLGEQQKKNTQYMEDIRTHSIHPIFIHEKKVEETLKAMERELQSLTKKNEEITHKIEEIQQQNMAVLLAKTLEEGKTCPVCGSTHHPQKAQDSQGQRIQELKEIKEGLQKDIEHLEKEKEENNKRQQQLRSERKGYEKLLEEKEKEEKNLQDNLQKLRIEYDQCKRELGVPNIEEEVREQKERDKQWEILQKEMAKLQRDKEKGEKEKEQLQKKYSEINSNLILIQQRYQGKREQIKEIQEKIQKVCGTKNPVEEQESILREIEEINSTYKRIQGKYNDHLEHKNELEKRQRGLQETLSQLYEYKESAQKKLNHALLQNQFDHVDQVVKVLKSPEECELRKNKIQQYENQLRSVKENMERLEEKMKGNTIEREQWQAILEKRQETQQTLEQVKKSYIEKGAQLHSMKKDLDTLEALQRQKATLAHQQAVVEDIDKLFQGNKFVEFISLRQLKYVAKEASQELKRITRGRYALELDADGNFIMRDDFNGGVRRGTQTLSGGETFLTSLALALALSSHIQLKGKAPLEFFFLDEGFGTLDNTLLEVVMDCLERLHSHRLSVGLISHVEELKQRIPRKLIVTPPVAGMNGTRIHMEME